MPDQATPNPVRTEAVIFDFDGTLVDSEPHHLHAINETVRPLGWAIDEREMFDRFVGTSDAYCFRTLAADRGEAITPERLEELQAAKLRVFLAAAARGEVLPYPGALELVRTVAALVPIAVCSGSLTRTIEPVLRSLEVWDLLTAVVGADEVERAKPDPASYRLCCEKLGVEPASVVAIEDTDHGVASAKGAGVRTVAVMHSLGVDRLGGADVVRERIAGVTLADLGLGERA